MKVDFFRIREEKIKFLQRHAPLVLLAVPMVITEVIGMSMHASGFILINDYLLKTPFLQGLPIWLLATGQTFYMILNFLFLLPMFIEWKNTKHGRPVTDLVKEKCRNRLYNYPVFLIISTYLTWSFMAAVFKLTGDTGYFTAELLAAVPSTVLNAMLVYYCADFVSRMFFIPYYFPDGDIRVTFKLFGKPSLFQRFWDLYLVNGVFPSMAVSGVIYLALQYGNHDNGEMFRAFVTSAIVGGVYLGFGFFLTGLTSFYVSATVRSLDEAAKNLSNEKFDVELSVHSDDQLGRLQRNMNEMAKSLREKNTMKMLFGHYVSPVVRDLILSNRISTRGDEIEAVILFSDIRGFTSMTEKYSAEKTVEILNIHFGRIVTAISDNQGFVDKFIGDAVMAVFDADLCSGRHREFALNAALQILEGMAETNRLLAIIGVPPISIGIGMACGMVIRGNIGSQDRREMTVIGDIVNTASRLETLTKETGFELIVTRSSLAAEPEALPNYRFEYLDAAKLRGKTDMVEIVGITREAGRNV